MEKKLNLSKIGTGDLEKKIASGKYAGETLTEMKALLKKRQSALASKRAADKKAEAPKKAAKKETPVKPAKKAAAPVPAEKKKTSTPKAGDTIRGFLKTLITPKSGTVAAVTYSEAKAAVAKKFPGWESTRAKALYPSEFNGVMIKLMEEGVITSRKKTEYQSLEASK